MGIVSEGAKALEKAGLGKGGVGVGPSAASDGSPHIACCWTEEPDAEYWTSDCGIIWIFNEGGPFENEMKFCLGCGKPLIIA